MEESSVFPKFKVYNSSDFPQRCSYISSYFGSIIKEHPDPFGIALSSLNLDSLLGNKLIVLGLAWEFLLDDIPNEDELKRKAHFTINSEEWDYNRLSKHINQYLLRLDQGRILEVFNSPNFHLDPRLCIKLIAKYARVRLEKDEEGTPNDESIQKLAAVLSPILGCDTETAEWRLRRKMAGAYLVLAAGRKYALPMSRDPDFILATLESFQKRAELWGRFCLMRSETTPQRQYAQKMEPS